MAALKHPVPLPRNPLRGVMSDAEIAALRRRNEWRAKTAREALGERYALHQANRVHAKRNAGVLTGFIARRGGS